MLHSGELYQRMRKGRIKFGIGLLPASSSSPFSLCLHPGARRAVQARRSTLNRIFALERSLTPGIDPIDRITLQGARPCGIRADGIVQPAETTYRY
jgi:hypothetical protein